MKKFAAFLIILGFGSALAIITTGLATTTACPTEDSQHCIWWGPLQGNGKGKIIINW